jgi:hypothetical protein
MVGKKEEFFHKRPSLAEGNVGTWSSQGRNSTLHPISEFAGGGLNRIVCLRWNSRVARFFIVKHTET